MSIQTVTDAIRDVGVDDNTLALFENQYSIQPMGVSLSLMHIWCFARQWRPANPSLSIATV